MDANRNTIFAVDFDGTLSFGKWPDVGEPNTSLFEYLIQKQKEGARIILYTCRTREALKTAVSFCRKQGLEFDAVNENLPELVDLYGEDTRKIEADIYIDDKAVNPITGSISGKPIGWKKTKRKESNHDQV